MSPRIPTEQRAAAAMDPDAPVDELTVRWLRKRINDVDAKVGTLSDVVVERILPTITNTCDDVRVIRYQVEQLVAMPYPDKVSLSWWAIAILILSFLASATSPLVVYLVTRS